jgi:alpha-beta hydrolase superfamily lysophospholipase
MQRFEGYFKGFDQAELFYQTWTPDKVRGILLITHGLAEHSDCYHHVAKELCEDGWKVVGWDLRGHGRSEGKRGFVKHLSNYIADLHVLLQSVIKPKEPLVMFGHSMGGLVTVRYNQLKKPNISAICLSSPALGLSVRVPKLKEALAHVAVKWVPTLTMYNEIKYEDLTRDEDMLKSHYSDTLRHDKISPGLFLSMVENFSLAQDAAAEIQVPVLLQLSGEDRLVSTDAAHDFFDKLPSRDKQLHIYPDSLHEVFNDRDRSKAIADLKKFVNPYKGAQ